jgi:hypothetical protein
MYASSYVARAASESAAAAARSADFIIDVFIRFSP